MKIAAWVVAILLLVAGIAIFIEALTTTNSVWLSIPLLALSGLTFRMSKMQFGMNFLAIVAAETPALGRRVA